MWVWNLVSLSKERKLRVDNRVLRKIFGLNREEVIGRVRKSHNEELHDLYCSPNLTWMIKSRKMRWAGHVACMGDKRDAWRVLVIKPEEKHFEDIGI
jgi:hypothetical protein